MLEIFSGGGVKEKLMRRGGVGEVGEEGGRMDEGERRSKGGDAGRPTGSNRRDVSPRLGGWLAGTDSGARAT